MPSSVSTRTIVAANDRRGSGSHAASNGGSSGSLRRSSRIAVIFTTNRGGGRSPGQYRRKAFGTVTPPNRLRYGVAITPRSPGGPFDR